MAEIDWTNTLELFIFLMFTALMAYLKGKITKNKSKSW